MSKVASKVVFFAIPLGFDNITSTIVYSLSAINNPSIASSTRRHRPWIGNPTLGHPTDPIIVIRGEHAMDTNVMALVTGAPRMDNVMVPVMVDTLDVIAVVLLPLLGPTAPLPR